MPHRDPPPSSLRLLAPGPSILEVGESLTSGVGGGATRELEGAEPEELKKPGTYSTTVRPGHTPLVWCGHTFSLQDFSPGGAEKEVTSLPGRSWEATTDGGDGGMEKGQTEEF